MVKMKAAVCRKPGVTHAEYVAYVQHVHGAISNEKPVSLRRHVQNHVFFIYATACRSTSGAMAECPAP